VRQIEVGSLADPKPAQGSTTNPEIVNGDRELYSSNAFVIY
jgi:hypothetical protein